MHAAEAIAAQAEGKEFTESDGWQDEDAEEQQLPGPFDPLTTPVIKGQRTARKRNADHLAGLCQCTQDQK